MKKILFLLPAIFLLLNCSRSNDNFTNNQQFFHPPSWIQGKWGVDNTALHKFTNDDFLLILSNSEISFKGLLQQNANIGATAKVEETSTDTTYNFKIISGSSNTTISTTEFQFKKVNPTKMEYVNSPYAGIYTYYLTKMN